MTFKQLAIILQLISFLTVALAGKKCCEGINAIQSKSCVDGSNITELPCSARYIVTASDNPSVDSNDILTFEGVISPAGEHCASRNNRTGEEIFLVCFTEEANDSFEYVAAETNKIFSLISAIFIVITITVYLIVPNLLDLQGICIVHSISGLAVSFLVLGINQFTLSVSLTSCHALAYITYTAFLYAFFWLHILSFHIWRTTVNFKFLSCIKHWKLIYHIVGITGPILLLILLLVADHSNLPMFNNMKPNIAETRCWFKNLKETLVYFYGPIVILLCLNIFFYIWTIISLWKQMATSDMKKAKVLKFRLLLCVKLFFIMGISWSFEVLSAFLENMNKNLMVVWVFTDAVNGLQGVLIFLILVVFRKKVLRGLANQSLCNIKLPNKWKTAVDDECEEIEEELSLSGGTPP